MVSKRMEKIIIGKIGKSYGVLGWLTIFSFTEKKENIFHYLPWFLLKEDKLKKIQLNNWKKHKNNFIVQIKNIIDRSIAMKLTNLNILIEKKQLPILYNDEYYWNDLIDCKVFNTKNIYLGQVINLMRTTYNDILIVQDKLYISNTKNILIPIIHQKIIKNIDSIHKIIIVKWN